MNLTAEQARNIADNAKSSRLQSELQTIILRIKSASEHGLYKILIESIEPENIQELEARGYKVRIMRGAYRTVIKYFLSWQKIV